MVQHDSDENSRTTIPNWMAVLASKVIPSTLIIALVGLFGVVVNSAILSHEFSNHVADYRQFKNKGHRYTAEQGEKVAEELAESQRELYRHKIKIEQLENRISRLEELR